MPEFACPVPPDIETASDSYRKRFAGQLGEFFLKVQQEIFVLLLDQNMSEEIRLLEVGGGHGQLVKAFLSKGHDVTIQGSSIECFKSLLELRSVHPQKLHFVVSPLWDLCFGDKSFDAVVSVRLLGHMEDTEQLLREFARVSRGRIVFDCAPMSSFNVFYSVFFWLKRFLESDTRPYYRHRLKMLRGLLFRCGFLVTEVRREFFFPMVIHRVLKRPRLSIRLEAIAALLGLTLAFGSPAIVLAEEAAFFDKRKNVRTRAPIDISNNDSSGPFSINYYK